MQISKERSSNYRERKETNGETTKEGKEGLLYSKKNRNAKPNASYSKPRRRYTTIPRRKYREQ
jgi:hypothetical protein